MAGDPLTPPVRPTRACLEQLALRVPADIPDTATPLHRVEHDLITKAQRLPDEFAASALERVLALKDRVWFKVKTGRWRGAGIRLKDSELAVHQPSLDPPGRWWLGGGGWRESGAPDDFYADLEARATREGSGSGSTSSDFLLPTAWDWGRLDAEAAVAWAIQIRRQVRRMIASSITSGYALAAEFHDHVLEVLVRAGGDDGTYLAVTAEGIYNPKVIRAILSAVPDLDADDWQAEPDGVAGIKPRAGQIIYSALLPPETAARILELVEKAGDEIIPRPTGTALKDVS